MKPIKCFSYLFATVTTGLGITLVSASWCQAALSTITAIEGNVMSTSLNAPWSRGSSSNISCSSAAQHKLEIDSLEVSVCLDAGPIGAGNAGTLP